MATLVGKKLSEVYSQITVRDPADYFLYTGDGVSTKFSPKYQGPIANGNEPAVYSDTTIPAHNDPSLTGSFAFGPGYVAFSTNYPNLSAVSKGTTLSQSPQARVILGTLGAQTLKTGDPVSYANTRTYTTLSKEINTTGDKTVLRIQDNLNGLNQKVPFEVFAPHAGGIHYTAISNTDGAYVRIEGSAGAGSFYPYVATGTMNLGIAANKWKELFCVNGVINTSDATLKTPPKAINDAVLDAWGDVRIITFQWLEAIHEKGIDGARWHVGVIAQQVRDAFSARGLDGTNYGLLCYDKWDEVAEPVYEPVKVIVKQSNERGEMVDVEVIEQHDTGTTKITREAGELWGIRADQCLWLEAAYQRRRCDRIEARLAALEAR